MRYCNIKIVFGRVIWWGRSWRPLYSQHMRYPALIGIHTSVSESRKHELQTIFLKVACHCFFLDSGNKNTLSQKLDPNGNGPFVEEGYNHTSKDITTPIREPGSQGYNEQTAFNSGIYFTTAGLIVPRNEIPKSCEVEDNKFDKPNEFNTGIYMPPNQAMDEDKKNAKRPKNHEACKSASSNETNLSNSGIYMSSSRATAKNKSGKNESSEASTGISMSPKQVKNKNEVDEMPEAREVGETTSVTKPNVLSSGIYMSAKQATGKHKDEMHQVLKDGESASVTKPNVSNTGIYMSPKQAKSSRE